MLFRSLDGMGQAIAEMIGESGRENLRLAFQPAKRSCMNDAIAIPLKVVAERMRGFGKTSTA